MSEIDRANTSLETALRALATDRTTRAVIDELEKAGIRVLLLKGPSTTRWLYPPHRQRGYADTDVLLHLADRSRASEVLLGLGFKAPLAGASPVEQGDHSDTFIAPASPGVWFPGAEVDVHHRISGVTVTPERAWSVLMDHLEPLTLLGRPTTALDSVARTVVIVLHAARDGLRKPQSLEDLRRLDGRLNLEDWRQAVDLADELCAREAFSAGLSLLPDGVVRMKQLGLGEPRQLHYRLSRTGVPVPALRLSAVLSLRSRRQQLAFVWREIWPTRIYLSFWAEQVGYPGLPLSVVRLLKMARLLQSLPSAVLSLLRVVRSTTSTSPRDAGRQRGWTRERPSSSRKQPQQ